MARVGSRQVSQIRVPANRFRQAADERWKDAGCLHANGRFEGAVYLCGYVLECFLKFVICETRKRKVMNLSEAKQLGHNLVELLDASGLTGALRQNRDLWTAFAGMNGRWSPELRYSSRSIDQRASSDFLQDTKDLRNWLLTQLRP